MSISPTSRGSGNQSDCERVPTPAHEEHDADSPADPNNIPFAPGEQPPGHIDTLLRLHGASEECRAGQTIHLQGIKDAKQHAIGRVGCKAWFCPSCGPRKQLFHGRHIAGRILAAGGNLFEAESTPAQWKKDRHNLKRLKATWVRITTRQGYVILGSTPTPHQFGRHVADPEQLIRTAGKALAELSMLKKAKGRCRPVNYSTTWKPERRARRYKKVGRVSARTRTEAVSILNRGGIIARGQAGTEDHCWLVPFVQPNGVTEQQVNALLAAG